MAKLRAIHFDHSEEVSTITIRISLPEYLFIYQDDPPVGLIFPLDVALPAEFAVEVYKRGGKTPGTHPDYVVAGELYSTLIAPVDKFIIEA